MKKTTIIILILALSILVAQSRQNLVNDIPKEMHKSFAMFWMQTMMSDQDRPEFGPPNERMEMIMIWKLTEDLNLTTEQADKFFPRMKEHREEIEKIENKIKESTEALHNKINDNKTISDKELENVIAEINSLEKQKIDNETHFIKELDGILDNIQIAKLVTFKTRFMRDIKDQIRKKREPTL